MSRLVVCMGSSMRVTPACDMPLTCTATGGKVVIINLQKTPADQYASLLIHEKVDKVIEMVMKHLEIPIPEFRRTYRLKMSIPANGKKVQLTGVDANGACYTLFKNLKVTGLSTSPGNFPTNARQV